MDSFMASNWVKYSSVKKPTWAHADRTSINCVVKFDHHPEELPFTASPKDPEPHGREIYWNAVNGKYGAIGSYTPPSEEIVSENSLVVALPEHLSDLQQFLDDANKENEVGTDRGCVLVWASMLDEMLRRAIKAFLVDDPKKTKDFLQNNGPLSSFSSRISAAYLLGLINDAEAKSLNWVRGIRNEFAHQYGIKLDNPGLSDKCQNLYQHVVNDGVKFPPRLQYTGACGTLLMQLSTRVEQAKISQRKQIRE